MPDWIVHVLIGLILIEIFNLKPKSLVLIGVLLPDALIKLELFHVMFPFPKYLFMWLFQPLHAPIGMALFTVLMLPFFKYNKAKTYGLLAVGWISHLVFDLTGRHLMQGQNLLLFPFSWVNIEVGWVWADEFYKLDVIFLIMLLAVLGYKKFLKK